MLRRNASLSLLFVFLGCGGDAAPADPGADRASCDAATFHADSDGDGFGDPFQPEIACEMSAGFVANDDDCDDADVDEQPGQVWMRDVDGDGYGDESTAVESCLRPLGYILVGGDCDDQDSTRVPGASWYGDGDGDGFGDPAAARDACGDVDGAVPDSSDCDDSDWLVHPDAEEVCDGLDNDCDDSVDDADEDIDPFSQVRLYEDLDGDGWGADVDLGDGCLGTEGTSPLTGDCDDADPRAHPERLDYRDEVDSNCDGSADTMTAADATQAWGGMVSGSFSYAIDSRDLDGDGLHEVLVASTDAGSKLGTVGYIPGALDPGDGSAWPTDASSLTWSGAEAGGRLGYGVRFAGDWDGDGVQDFMVGAPYAEGESGVFYILSLDDASGGVGDALFRATVDAESGLLGFETAAIGDVTADGKDDILVSVRRDSRLNDRQGSVLFVPGGGTGSDIIRHDGASSNDQFGFSVATLGDIDGDGLTDVAIGAPYGDAAVTNGGEVSVFMASDLATVQAPEDAVVQFVGSDIRARAGTSLRAPGDVNGDGHADVLIGAPEYEGQETGQVSVGSAFVQLGSGTGWESTDLMDAHLRMYDTSDDQATGRFLGAPGDIDGDERADVLVTAHRWDQGSDSQVGRVFGVLGSHAAGTLYFPDDADLVIEGSAKDDYLGRGIAPAGDRTGDGLDDFWIGASGAGRSGMLFLLEGALPPL